MSAKYDAELCARLAREAREDDRWSHGFSIDQILTHRVKSRRHMSTMADQLDAARAEVERLRQDEHRNLAHIARAEASALSLTTERDELRRTVETLQAQIEAVAPVVDLVEAFVETVNAATRHFANRGKGGQHVPFHGDFAGANPSTMSRLEWWARAFASKLGKEET